METLESGSNMLTGVAPDMILKSIDIVLNDKQDWQPPVEYLDKDVSSKVVKIMPGYFSNRK